MFSQRVPALLARNRLTKAVARHRASGRPLLDLTLSNPTKVGLSYPASVLTSITDRRSLAYEPEALGLRPAREAVAAYYASHGESIDPGDVILTASTSEAYGLLFKLLCDSGNAVLVPVPSYPLFEHLARLEAVECLPYPLEYHGLWSVDVDALGPATTAAARALLVVAPNNPTGSLLRAEQWPLLERHCARHGLALIVDEVFRDYLLEPADDGLRSVVACQSEGDVLRMALGGLSKAAGLPQMKLAWIVMRGPASLVEQARDRLELICDTYLSVSTPVQVGAARLLEDGTRIRAAIASRIRENLESLRSRASRSPACDVLRVEGGWSAVMRVPAIRPEEAFVLDLLERDGVLAHPGFFFDFPDRAHVVVSLLPAPDVFDEAIERLCRRVEAECDAPGRSTPEGVHE